MSAYIYRKCCVPRCKSTGQTTHLHRFPKDEEKTNIWKENIGNEKIMKRTLQELKSTYFVCHLHFEPQYLTKTCGRLKRSAVPTIFFAPSTADHSDVETLLLEDGLSEGDKTSLADQDVEEIGEVEFSNTVFTTIADGTTVYDSEEHTMLDSVEDVNQPLIDSVAQEYESMCMEIIGDFPEGPSTPEETHVSVKVENEAEHNEPLLPPNPIVNTSNHRKLQRAFPPTWRPPEDASDEAHIATAIIDTSHPLGHLSLSTEALLRKHLYQLLDDAALNSDENLNLPGFYGWSYHEGLFQVQCVDKHARDWLEQAISLLPGECLSVVSVQVPAPLVRASIWVPDDIAPVIEIKQRLDQYAARQGINTRDWCVFQHMSKQKPKGTLLVIGMPPTDVVRVKEKGGRLLYRLNALKVNFMEDEKQSRDNRPISSSASKAPPP